MEFKVANASLLQSLKPGTAIAFEFVERLAGEWVVTSIIPAAPAPIAAKAASKSHSGH